ncbi:MAG: 1-deoxy-D-xylulose-5-phosphate synthase [Desulfobacteraceae bacterium]|nr:1-deoxy-D-xylulose-5-phosphate synthase [Desulfobacteraceae bacterium]
MNNISQRDAFLNKLYGIAKVDRNIVLVSADMGAPALDKIRRDLSSQYVGVGIAEQQAIVLASGLALGGKKVFAYAIAPFITLRCYEQIRIDLAGMNIPVTLVGVGAGFSYEDSGPTHHAVEDLSIMRILPNLRVHTITDSVMAAAFAELSCKAHYPNYVRLDRETLPTIYSEGDDFSSGMARLRDGKELCIVATGNMVHRALDVADELAKHSVDVGVLDVYTLPINDTVFLNTIDNAQKIVTLEEQTLRGGFGSSIIEVLSDNNRFVPIKRFGLDFKTAYCYKYGGRKNIQLLYGLDTQSITNAILDWVK